MLMAVQPVGKSGFWAVLVGGVVLKLFPRKPTTSELFQIARSMA